jgi:hypothetical protein
MLLAGLTPAATVSAFTVNPATVWINEIHYDNTGTDAGEAIEIAGPAGTNLTGWSIVLYNGSGGAVYDTDALSGLIPDQQDGLGTVVLDYPSNGIQNGAPDGIALANGSTLVQFLSYEGAFAGVGGVANGVTSTDIGVSEAGTEVLGQSLQLNGTGGNYQDFTWSSPAAATFGAVNTGQTFVGDGDAAPFLASSSPDDGATGVAANAQITITFSEAVTVDPGAIELDCVSAQVTPTADPKVFELVYIPPLPDGAICTIEIGAAGIHDTDDDDPPDEMTADVTIDFTVVAADPCAGAFTPIPDIQGDGATAAITGSVTTEGIVVGDYEGPSTSPQTHLRGYYIQDAAGDGDIDTSDGIFVFNGPNTTAVNVGDSVRVTGTAADFQNQTQITQASLGVCGTDQDVDPVDVVFPISQAELEQYEGMLVRLPQTMVVTEHFQLGRFGQVVLSAGTRLQQPTAVVEPGALAMELQAENNLRKIILDDELQNQNPDPIRFGRGDDPLSAENTLRGGDTATGVVGVMTYTWAGNSASGNAFRVRPYGALDGEVEFVAANPRPEGAPDVGGSIRVAGMNLLNYFNTFDGLPDPQGNDNCNGGVGGVAMDCRGADTQAEFDRQWPKTVAAILGLDADVLGVNEVENDGYGPSSALADLVGHLNDEAGAGTYAYIDVDAETGEVNAAGTDAIKVGLIYKPDVVTPVGDTAVLNSVAFVNGGDPAPRSRPSIAQAFETQDGARFIVDVNHFKSKGSACTVPDAGDGQGNCNTVRTNAAIALRDWLEGDPTGTGDEDVYIVGDLNSYAKEDPVEVLTSAGYTNLVDARLVDPYSFVFDGQWGYLDYALGTTTAVDQVVRVGEWHINADEPSVLDYNTDFKSAGQIESLYAAGQFRVSDHDPILLGLNLTSDRPTADAGGPYSVIEGGTVQVTATGVDPNGTALTFEWDLDDNDTFETPGATAVFSAAGIEAPATRTIAVKVTDATGQFAIDEATIDVIWDFGGFQPPLAPFPTVNTANAGSTVPVKFSLAGNQGSAILDGPPHFQRANCTTWESIGSPTPVTGPGLVYNVATDTYTFEWKTPKAWAGRCGTLIVALADGTEHLARFELK